MPPHQQARIANHASTPTGTSSLCHTASLKLQSNTRPVTSAVAKEVPVTFHEIRQTVAVCLGPWVDCGSTTKPSDAALLSGRTLYIATPSPPVASQENDLPRPGAKRVSNTCPIAV
eukprot:m.196176 g.196176  ORF g.196176 m.196176 type:complete len:116 (+) comp17009_c0_seq8:2912-3259(+)